MGGEKARSVCACPEAARCRGSGDIDDAAHFTCVKS